MRTMLELLTEWLELADDLKNIEKLLQRYPEDNQLIIKQQEIWKKQEELQNEWEVNNYG